MAEQLKRNGEPRYPAMIGERYGRLVVASAAGKRGTRRVWNCSCDCGGSHVASTSDLRYGGVQSCGCLLAGATAANSVHGHSSRRDGVSGTYNSWRGMIERCTNPNVMHYERYGGRGITVCDRWKTFANFLKDMGERPPRLTIERKDNDGNYELGNCKWATYSEQRHNRRDTPRTAANDNAAPTPVGAE